MGDDFASDVYQPPSNRPRIRANRTDRSSDVLFERLQQKMTDQHRIIPGGIGIQPLEGQLLVAKILQSAVGQLVTTAIMVAGNNTICFQIILSPGPFEHHIDGLSLADIGGDNRIGTATGQIELTAIMDEPTEKDSPEPIPIASSASEFNILPGLFFLGVKLLPALGGVLACHFLDALIHLPATDIADLKRFTERENLLIEKAAVHAHDDGDIPSIVSSDFDNHVSYHLLHAVAVIGVLVLTAKHRIHDKTVPGHLQRLEALLLPIGRLNPLPTQGIVIVHDHRVDPQFDDIRPGYHRKLTHGEGLFYSETDHFRSK